MSRQGEFSENILDSSLNAVAFIGTCRKDASSSAVVCTYGILPSAHNPRWLIPIGNRAVTASSLALYQPSLRRAKLMKEFTILLASAGFSRVLLRDRIYFEKHDEEIKKIFGRDDLHYAIFIGTAGCHRKATVQVMNGEGGILGYIKVSGSCEIDKLLANEAEVLCDLQKLAISTGFFPKVLLKGTVNGANILVLDTLKSTASTFRHKLSDAHADFLSEIFWKSSRLLKFKDSPFEHDLAERLEAAAGTLPKELEVRYRKVLDILDQTMAGEVLRFGLCHRDFTPWNTFFQDGKLYVFDWEYTQKNYPPLFDILHFIIQDGIQVRKMKPEGLLRKVGQQRDLIKKYLESIHVSQSLMNSLLLCYLLDISLLYVERENGEINDNITGTIELWGGMMDLVIQGRSVG